MREGLRRGISASHRLQKYFQAGCPRPSHGVLSHIISPFSYPSRSASITRVSQPLTSPVPHQIESSCKGSTTSKAMRIQVFWIYRRSATASDRCLRRCSQPGRAFRRSGSETCSNTPDSHISKAQDPPCSQLATRRMFRLRNKRPRHQRFCLGRRRKCACLPPRTRLRRTTPRLLRT